MSRRVSISVCLALLSLAVSAFAAPDSTVINGDIRIIGAGSGLAFPDGSVQTTATLQGPAGPPGPQGPAGAAPVPVLRDVRWSVMWQVASGGVHHIAVRSDGSVRNQDDPSTVLTKVGVGQYCIKAVNALEGAMGVVQNGPAGATIQVSMGQGSFCNDVPDSNITVWTYGF